MAMNVKASAGILTAALAALTTLSFAPANAVLQPENPKHNIAQWLGLEEAPISIPTRHVDATGNYLVNRIDAREFDGYDSVIVQDVKTGGIFGVERDEIK